MNDKVSFSYLVKHVPQQQRRRSGMEAAVRKRLFWPMQPHMKMPSETAGIARNLSSTQRLGSAQMQKVSWLVRPWLSRSVSGLQLGCFVCWDGTLASGADILQSMAAH